MSFQIQVRVLSIKTSLHTHIISPVSSVAEQCSDYTSYCAHVHNRPTVVVLDVCHFLSVCYMDVYVQVCELL